MNNRTIIIFDFETNGKDPKTCEPVQVAALAINPFTLNIIKDSEFNVFLQPPELQKLTVAEYLEDKDKLDTAQWHGKLKNKPAEEIVAEWKEYPDQKTCWTQFSDYINKFNVKKAFFSAPMAGGMNVRNFDIPIANRLNEKYGIKTMFWPRDVIDLMELCFYWFEGLPSPPKNYKMDTLREFFGLSDVNSHDALQDVKDTAEILIRFMKLHRNIAKKVKFKGAFNES